MADKQSALAAFNGVVAEITAIAVAPPPQPGIVSFTAAPAVLTVGGSVILSAEFANAERIELDHVAVPFEADGKSMRQVVTPTVSRGYTLVAEGAPGTTPATASLDVTVNVAPSVPAPAPIIVPLNMAASVYFEFHWSGAERYDRVGKHVVFATSSFSVKFRCLAEGGGRVPFEHPRYSVRVNGVERGAYVVVDKMLGVAPVTLSGEPDGPNLMEVVGTDLQGNDRIGAETPVPFDVHFDRTGQAKNSPVVIVQVTTQALARESRGQQSRVRIPKTLLKDRDLPIEPVTGTPFFTAIPMTQITRVMLLPTNEANALNTYKPCITKRGILVTENMQGYGPADMNRDFPRVPELDGKRGKATLYYGFSCEPGRGGKWYITTPYAFALVSNQGERHTFAGLIHQGTPPWVEDAAASDCVLKGDWSNVPAARRKLLHSWGIVFDRRSTITGGPIIGGEESHPGKVIGYTVDDFGRMLRFEFDGQDPNRHDPVLAKPPVIYEAITGLLGPWSMDIDYAHNEIVIAERDGNRISRFDLDTYAPRGYIAQGSANCATIGSVPARPFGVPRRFEWIGSFATGLPKARLEPCIAPERVRVFDGFVYWGAMAQAEIRRAPSGAQTTAPEICCRSLLDFGGVGPYHIDFCINDNTPNALGAYPRGGFGPHGTIFTVNFMTGPNYGRPVAYLMVAGNGLTHSQTWNWTGISYAGPDAAGAMQGPGGLYPDDVYPISPGVGNGMLGCVTSMDGLVVYRQRVPTDGPDIDLFRLARGETYWRAKAYHLIYGQHGNGYTSLRLPFGENADLDYTLTVWGHKP